LSQRREVVGDAKIQFVGLDDTGTGDEEQSIGRESLRHVVSGGSGGARAARGIARLAAQALRVQRRADESGEQRVRARWARLELGMELATHEPWMIGELDDLDQRAVGRE